MLVVTQHCFHDQHNTNIDKKFNIHDYNINELDSKRIYIYILSVCLPGYLSSPHVGHELSNTRDAHHGPVITSPVVPAAASGKHTCHWSTLMAVSDCNLLPETDYNDQIWIKSVHSGIILCVVGNLDLWLRSCWHVRFYWNHTYKLTTLTAFSCMRLVLQSSICKSVFIYTVAMHWYIGWTLECLWWTANINDDWPQLLLCGELFFFFQVLKTATHLNVLCVWEECEILWQHHKPC